ncbi:hypothetical protein BDW22DRAFT_1431670 [Trametopsis cervina]|nr:hypothetical protein BDW22DRAFT_1431670 [Trametopsis cervina]
MAPRNFEFNLATTLNSLEYLSDTLDWLASIDDYDIVQESAYDALLERLQSLIHTIRRTQNRHPLVNRLPPEILSAVFESLMRAYPRVAFGYRSYDEDRDSSPWTFRDAIAIPSLVCRHWRNVVIGTPALWTDINVTNRTLLGDVDDGHAKFISIQLVRSGGRPLNVHLDVTLSQSSQQPTFMQDLLKQAHRIRHFSTQVPISDEELYRWTENAKQLEVLSIRRDPYPWNGRPLLSEHTPHLQTLILPSDVRWQTGSFRFLRHLLLRIADTTPLADLVRGGLMGFFASNAHTLEDMVVLDPHRRERRDEREVEETLEGVSPVDMPALKRLVLQGSSLFHKLIEPRLVLHDCACDYMFRYNHDLQPPFSHRFPSKKLFLSAAWGVGINGHEAMRMHSDNLQKSLAFLVGERDVQVQELWLWSGWQGGDTSDSYCMMLKPLRGVEKLVVLHGEWLERMADMRLFPKLSELQLHTQAEWSYRTLLDFLAKRKEDGRAVETLRLVHDPRVYCDVGDFRIYEEKKSELESYVGNVVYDDVPDDRQPPRMELPVVCKTKSPVHIYWNPWELE